MIDAAVHGFMDFAIGDGSADANEHGRHPWSMSVSKYKSFPLATVS
jgi:hypothetical protein